MTISYKTASYILAAELSMIPVMWMMGHRGNNFLLLFFVLFAVFMQYSDSFRQRVQEGIAGLALNDRRRKRLLTELLAIALILAVISLINDKQVKFFDLDREDAFGTLYAGFLLAANLFVVYLCFRANDKRGDRWKWILVCILFGGMALDELSEFHHWLTYDIWHLISGRGREVLIDGIVLWITLLSPFILAIIFGLLLFIFRVLSPGARKMALIGLTFWVVSQGLEATIEGHLILHVLEVALEELFEMTGSIFFIGSFLMELKQLKTREEVNVRENAIVYL